MNKTYHHDHMEKRARVAYEKNMAHIEKHNHDARNGKYTFEIRANNMADISQESYLRRFVRLTESLHPDSVPENEKQNYVEDEEALLGSARHTTADSAFIPDSLDWRELGFQMKPLNQETCGSCYAFAVSTSVEGQVFRRTGKVVLLSAQQIVDCSIDSGNSGCSGGSLRTTLKYLHTKGLMRSVDYPYASEVSIFLFCRCKFWSFRHWFFCFQQKS